MHKASKATDWILRNTAGVTSLVSTRIYPTRADQGAAYPYIVHTIAGTRPTSTKDGPSRFDFAQVLVHVYSQTETEAQTIAEAVRVALERKTPGTYNGVAVAQIEFINDAGFPEDDAANEQIYYHVLEFDVNYHR